MARTSVAAACGAMLLATLAGCTPRDDPATPRSAKGGDDRTGPYEVVEGWWKAAPDHVDGWGWGSVAGVAADTPDRIIVAIWGDQNAEGEERPNGSNYLVVVNRDGEIVENWSQWDSLFNRPHQVYIDPYDPERHVWVVERAATGSTSRSSSSRTTDRSWSSACSIRPPCRARVTHGPMRAPDRSTSDSRP